MTNQSLITFENIKSIEAPSSGGSGGILRVNLKHGPAGIYLKAGIRVAAEAFAAELAERIDVLTPKMQLMERDTPEWLQTQEAIRSFLDLQADESDAAANMIVFDLISSGRVMASVSAIEGIEFLNLDPSLFKKSVSETQMKEIGALIAFDMVINNSDRFPSPIWDNSGNGGNVIFETVGSESHFVGIDHTPVMLNVEDRTDYIEKLRNVFVDLFSTSAENTSCAQSISEFIKRVVKYEMDDEDRASVTRGILETLKKMISPSGFVTAWLQETREKMEIMVVNDPIGVWKESMSAIDIEFLIATVDVVREVCKDQRHGKQST